ncbi:MULTISPECIES: hypothetical protein [unclassified Beijerinckia]|uniref:hypothetical protein n=1 Tax=unclassified Beijerinckia TaxID=2638183 RepID=UPI000B81FF6C|nr:MULTISPECIES: hypothetical protein [unclassified Beijerinckia]MDH7799801.1 hypothetical protein [Beijerinckia sp. GAS462]
MHDHHHSSASGHGHSHEHAHDHAHEAAVLAPVHARAAIPGFSLLRLSAGQRLAGAGLIVIALWAAVFWALK